MTMPYPPQPPAVAPTCYRHPDRPTYIGCTRCGRPACPECLRPASVGHQCLDCVQAAAQSIPQVRTPAGGVLRTGTPIVSYTLIAVNVALFVLQQASPRLLGRMALIPFAVAGGDSIAWGHRPSCTTGCCTCFSTCGRCTCSDPLSRNTSGGCATACCTG